jgi:Zn-dependent protease
MLIDAFRSGFSADTVVQLLLFIPVILISLTVHEYSHGYAAYKCGDMTARNFGRLTLNPVKHLDPIGTIMMLIFGFGYAKPVPINPRNFRKPRRDICIVSVAGPLSNLVLCFFGILFWRLSVSLLYKFGTETAFESNLFFAWYMFITNFYYANAVLCVFNMIPIPPLDGSRLLSTVLPAKAAFTLAKYENYIMIGVLVLLYFGALDGIISFVGNGIIGGIDSLLNFVPFLNLYN